jgi:hypothetical protein
MRNLRKLLLLTGCLLWSLNLATGQNAANPFELVPRLDKAQRQANTPETPAAGTDSMNNPFDLIYDSPRDIDTTPYEVDPKLDPIITNDKERFFFFAIGIMVLLFTSGVSLVGNYLNKSFQSFVYDNAFNQYYREQEGRGAAPYFVLYILFFINLGFFLVLLFDYYQVSIPIPSYYLQWLVFSTIAATLFLFKQFILILIRWIFPVESDIRRYIFLIIVFSIVIGTLLVPANLLIAYGPDGSKDYVLWGTIILIGLVYLLRAIRGLFIANRQLLFHRFHFLLYICTVEIAPIAILVRLILNQL